LGERILKAEDRQEENEEIQRRDQDPHNPAYDEAEHTSDLEGQ
jgi:hypothetical protein